MKDGFIKVAAATVPISVADIGNNIIKIQTEKRKKAKENHFNERKSANYAFFNLIF